MLTPSQIFIGSLLRNIREGSEYQNFFARIISVQHRTFAAQYLDDGTVNYFIKATLAFEAVEP